MGVAYARGLLLFDHGRYRQAAEQFRTALSADAGDVPAHAMLSLCLVNDGQPRAAIAEADEAVRLAPDAAVGHFARAQVLPHVPIVESVPWWYPSLSSGDDTPKRLRHARAALDEAIRLQPRDPQFHVYGAWLEAWRRRWNPCLRAAERALALDPTNVAAANWRARALTALGRAHEADRVIGDALRIDPEYAPSHGARGWSLLRAGRTADAEAAFREALRLNPSDREVKLGLFHSRAARWAAYRWPLRFILWRVHGVAVELLGTTLFVAAASVGPYRDNLSLPGTVAAVVAQSVVLLIVLRPLYNLSARLRR